MNQISATFGGSKTTLYTHFLTKEDIFLAVVDSLARGRVDNAFGALTLQGDISQTLIEFGQKYLTITCSNEIVKIFRMVISESDNSTIGDLLYDIGPKLCRNRIANYFNEKKSEGVIRECDPSVAAIHYLRLIESDLAELFLLGVRGAPSAQDIEKSVKDGVAVFLDSYLVSKRSTT